MFDPYRKWLGIPEGSRPPTHYQLLGLVPGEQDRDVIEAAAVRQSAYVRNFQTGKYAEEATRILNEIAEARLVLLDPQKRAAYDRQLQNKNLTLAEERSEAEHGAREGGATSRGPAATRPLGPATGGLAAADEAARSGGAAKRVGTSPGSRTPDVIKGREPGGMGSGIGMIPSAGTVSLGGVPERAVPAQGAAANTVPAATVPAATVPAATVPAATVPAHTLPVQAMPGHTVPAPGGRAVPAGPGAVRPPVAAVVRDPLAAIEAAVPPPAVVLPTRRQTRNVAAIVAVGGLAILVVIGGIVGLSLLNRGGSRPAAVATTEGTGGAASSPAVGTASSGAAGTYSPPGEDDLEYDDPLSDPGRSRTSTAAAASAGTGSSSTSPSGLPSSGSAVNNSGSAGSKTGTFDDASGTKKGTEGDRPSTSGASPNSTTEEGPAPIVTSDYAIDWSASRLSVPVSRDSIAVYAAGNSPFVFVDGAVYNLSTGEQVYRVDVPRQAVMQLQRKASLAADGSMLVFAAAPFGETAEIYDCRSGVYYERVLPPAAAARVMYLAFRQPTEVVVCWQSAPGKAQVWNLKTKKKLREMNCERFDGLRADFSSDSRHMAVPVPGGVLIYDIWSAKLAARAAVPGSSSVPDGVRFSNDGQELAAVTDNGQRVVCWNASAEVQEDFRLGFEARTPSYKGCPIEWAPDGKSWLLFGHMLIDRASRRAFWKLKPGFETEVPHRFVGQNQLAVVRGTQNGGALTVISIPWTEIGDAMANKPSAGARQTPVAGPLSVQVQATKVVAGSADRAAAEIRNMIALRLGQLGIQVLPGEDDELRVTYSEEPATKRVAPSGKQPGKAAAGGDAVREVNVVRIALAFKFYRGGKESRWSQELSTEVESTSDTFDDWTLREAVTELLKDLRAPAWSEAQPNVIRRLPLESNL